MYVYSLLIKDVQGEDLNFSTTKPIDNADKDTLGEITVHSGPTEEQNLYSL